MPKPPTIPKRLISVGRDVELVSKAVYKRRKAADAAYAEASIEDDFARANKRKKAKKKRS